MKEISEANLIVFDSKKAVDSEKFRVNQQSKWVDIKKWLEEERAKIKAYILDNFEVLKCVSDCFDKISKNRDDIKDELTKRIREEWQA